MQLNLFKSILSIYLVALSFFSYSQSGGVSISNTNTVAHPSAVLDVSSTSPPYMGMLIPRMSTANRNAIVSPATGLQVFNTDCGINEYYTGSCWISLNQNLKAPLHITCSGTTDLCANESRTFSIAPVSGATSYEWAVPAGASITSGQGSTSIAVAFGNNSGEVCVTADNNCETSTSRCIDIHINPVPATPGSITGPTAAAPGTTASYFITAVTGAGVYNWTVPSGVSITSGAGTTNITVSFSCSASSGNVSVVAQNNCGLSAASTLSVTLNSLSASAGPAITSPGTLGGSPTASGGTSPYSYSWVPTTNLSSSTVANPATTVCSTTTYTVIVTDSKGCSASSSATASVTNPIPATPGSISGSTSASCGSTGNVYSISAVNGATAYTWTAPSDAIITSGQNTTSIAVTFGNASGNITVTAGNNCGTSSASTLAVIVTGGGGSGTQTYNYTGSVQTFTVPSCVTSATIETWGGAGADHWGVATGGKGAYIKGTVTVTPGSVLSIIVGQAGIPGCGNAANCGGGGGGGSFVYTGTNLLMAAGAGGGGSLQNDGHPKIDGDHGQTTASGSASKSGAAGGTSGSNGSGDLPGKGWNSVQSNPSGNGTWGGYGGGGDAQNHGGGGGGGYSGGGGQSFGGNGCNYGDGGGGGGSFNSGTNQTNTSGVQSGNGKVTISW